MDNRNQQLLEYSQKLTKDWFLLGEGLKGVPLKNFTSGDWIDKKNNHRHEGLEGITHKIITKGFELYGLQDRARVDQSYFEDPTGEYESQRMDNHIWIDEKCVIVEEDRAWIDKPFYTLKRNVVRTFMKLPYVRERLSDDVIFIFCALQVDVTDETRKTREMLDGYGDRIVEINLSGHNRRPLKYNYFDNGVCQKNLEKYIETLCGVFEKYAK